MSVDTDSLAVLSAFEVSPCGPEGDGEADTRNPADAMLLISKNGQNHTLPCKQIAAMMSSS